VTRAIRKYSKDFIALIVLFLIALGVSGYIIANQDARPTIPFLEATPKKLKFDFSDAQAVTPGQGQSIRVAGVQIGKITTVDVKDGHAVVTTEIEPKWWNKLQPRSDATALLRPRTGLKDMFIEFDPGGRGTKLKDGAELPVQNTSPDIDPDEFLSAFDADTRAYLKLLITGAGKGLKNRGSDLNRIFKDLGPTNRDLARVTKAVAQRKTDLKELIHRYGDLTNALADKDKELRTLVTASDAVFRAFASQNQNISLAVSKLPPTLNQTTRTLNKANTFARVLAPTLDSLQPAFRQLDTTNRQVLPFARAAEPITRKHIRPFVRTARPVVRNLRPAAVNLAKATPDFTKTFYELNRFFNMAAYNPGGAEPVSSSEEQNKKRDEGYLFWLGWVAMNTDSLFQTSDANGPLRRVYLGVTCEVVKQQLVDQPAAGPLLGLSNALNDPGLCGGTNTGNGTNGSSSPLPPLPKGFSLSNKKAGTAKGGG
jgi:phospholipid/cholesterol/gamma-HCH transport system substrate-binding protein